MLNKKNKEDKIKCDIHCTRTVKDLVISLRKYKGIQQRISFKT